MHVSGLQPHKPQSSASALVWCRLRRAGRDCPSSVPADTGLEAADAFTVPARTGPAASSAAGTRYPNRDSAPAMGSRNGFLFSRKSARAVSSAEEQPAYNRQVTGSSPVPPTRTRRESGLPAYAGKEGKRHDAGRHDAGTVCPPARSARTARSPARRWRGAGGGLAGSANVAC